MKKDDNKNEQTIIFSRIDPADRDDSEDDRDFALERTQEIKHIKASLPDDDFYDEHEEEQPKKVKKSKKKRKKDSSDDNTINMTDIRAARKKEKVHRRLKKLIIIVIILLMGAGVYITRGIWVPKLEGILDRPHDTIINDGVTQTGNFPIKVEESSANIIRRLDNNIIIADGGHIYYYDENGKLRDTVYHSFGNPMIKTAGKRILCFDNGGNTFRVYNKSGEVYEKSIEDQIIYADIAQNSNVAVITQTEKYVACLTIYDSNGTEIYRWSCGKRIMAVSFTDNGDGCYISAFSAEDGEVVSEIYYIEFDSTEELMKSEKLNGLVLDICENDNDNLWAAGDGAFYMLDKDGKLIDSYEYDSDMTSFDMNEKCAAVVFEGVSHESMTVALFDSDSDNVQPKTIECESGSPKKALCDGDRAFILSSSSLDAYDGKGNLLATAAVSADYSDFVFYNDAVFFIGPREVNKILFQT